MSNSDEHSFRPIRQWNEDDRPREKLLQKGRHVLSEAELLAIIIGTGTRRESAVELARRIMHLSGNNLLELGKKSVEELTRLNGVGPAKAVSIVAALELGRRRQEAAPVQRNHIRQSRDIYELMGPRIGDLPNEEFWAIAANRSNKVISTRKISIGGIDATTADLRLILRFALDNAASSLIVCHNHPSGNLKPSDSDIRLTSRLKQAAELMDMRLLDHLIITDSGYMSFADESLL
ncbi:MAG: DNA repair protein RadC [Bacteroidia bacterium]|nr:DNA repair protein RadC [Bacteroidia bacterium]MCC6768400.1 DNA repair protein RadC [Bacteroidia bacterium]